MVTMYTSCHYAMLCCALKRAILKLSFLAKPHHPNMHDYQIALVDPLEGYKSYTLTTHEVPCHGPNQGHAHNPTIATTTDLIAIDSLAMNLTSGLSILSIWVAPALLSKMGMLATVVASGT